MINEGHEIGNHTFSHRPLTYMTDDEIIAEITDTTEKISSACGTSPSFVRAPYGDINEKVQDIGKSLNIAFALYWERISRSLSVYSPGPSSKVRAISFFIMIPPYIGSTFKLYHRLYLFTIKEDDKLELNHTAIKRGVDPDKSFPQRFGGRWIPKVKFDYCILYFRLHTSN